MKIVAVMPIKLNNERCPGKNTRLLGGKPLLQWELDNLLAIGRCEIIDVFCSSKDIIKYLPAGINFLQRAEYLDSRDTNFIQIFDSYMALRKADVYVYSHATAPYVSKESMITCIDKVIAGDYDSAFCAEKMQDFLWQEGTPMNFDATNLPRTQDLKPIYRETSGIYVFKREVYEKYHRRIGIKPFIREMTYREMVDIDTADDFELAEKLI